MTQKDHLWHRLAVTCFTYSNRNWILQEEKNIEQPVIKSLLLKCSLIGRKIDNKQTNTNVQANKCTIKKAIKIEFTFSQYLVFWGFFFIKLIHNYINHVKLWFVVCLGSILHSNTSLFLYSNIPILWQIESILVDLEFWKGLFKFVLKIAWFLSNTVLSQYYVTLACIYSDICLLCWFFNYFKSFFFFS